MLGQIGGVEIVCQVLYELKWLCLNKLADGGTFVKRAIRA